MTGDLDYLKAIERIWENVVNKKIYITAHKGTLNTKTKDIEMIGNVVKLMFFITLLPIGTRLNNHVGQAFP